MKYDLKELATVNPENLRCIIPTLTIDEIVELIKCVGETHRVKVTDIDGNTPANRWSEKGEVDPFANYLNKKRSELPMGDFTDDELANAMYLNYDRVPPVQEMLSGNAKMPIVYMTAGKERMRWLSRQVVALQSYIATHLPKPAEPEEYSATKISYPVTSVDCVETVHEGTGEFKNIILNQLAHTPAKEIKLSEPLYSILKKGGGFPRGSFWFIGAHTSPEKSRLHTLEGTQHDNSKDATGRGESQGD